MGGGLGGAKHQPNKVGVVWRERKRSERSAHQERLVGSVSVFYFASKVDLI